MSTITSGCIVRLTTGGPFMAVGLDFSGAYSCYWWATLEVPPHSLELRDYDFNSKQLELIEPAPETPDTFEVGDVVKLRGSERLLSVGMIAVVEEGTPFACTQVTCELFVGEMLRSFRIHPPALEKVR